MSGSDPTSPDDKALTTDEMTVAQGMLDGLSVRQIGASIGKPHSTAYDVMRRPHVKAYVDQCLREAQDAARRLLVRGTTQGVATLIEIAADKKAAASARVAAASKLLDKGIPTEVRGKFEHGGSVTLDGKLTHAADGTLAELLTALGVEAG